MSLIIKKDDSRAIISAIESMGKKRVLVGIPSEKGKRKKGQETNAEIGYIQENGSVRLGIPPRPFMKKGISNAIGDVAKILKNSAKSVLTSRETIEKGLNKSGIKTVSSIKNVIRTSDGVEALKASTIEARKRKGFLGERPLIRTAQLINSITYIIKDR